MNTNIDIPALFGTDVFSEAVMKQRLDPEVFHAWKQCITTGSSLPLQVANSIAEAMKVWAIEKGAATEEPAAGCNGKDYCDLDENGEPIPDEPQSANE